MCTSEHKNAKVFFRIYPLEKIKWDYLRIRDRTIYMRNLQDLVKESKKDAPQKFWEFKSDGVFFNNNQEFIYNKVMDGVLDRVTRANNAIIAAYGQTGTGKSVTLGGLHLSVQDLGIIPRIICDLFTIKKNLPRNIKMCIQISYMEFSPSTVVDLLKEYPNIMDVYRSREATSKIKVSSIYETLKLIYKGEGRKTFNAETRYMSNLRSSVVTFYVTTKNLDFTTPQKTTSRLHVVDMVGVDTVGNMSSFFKDPYEIGKGNVIKSNLEQFLLCLIKNIPNQIKLRQRTDPLIYFLGSDLSNESIMRFIGHIRVLRQDLIITISMLRFGQLVRGLKPKIKEITYEINEEVQVQHLQNELEQLQKDQIHCSVLLNQNLTNQLNQDRIDHIQRTIKEYLRDNITEINIINVAEASAVFKEFKEICNQFEVDRLKLCEELQAELSMKHKRDSKSSSKSSLKGMRQSSKRLSKKSKDSFGSIDEKKKREDHSINSPKISESSRIKVTKKSSSLSGSSPMNKKRSSSFSVPKRPSITRKKSITTTSVADKKESKSFLNEINLMPEIIPEYKEAWEMYISDSSSSYKKMLDFFIKNANEMQRIYGAYMPEIKKLQQCKQSVEVRKNEALEAQMIRTFNEANQPPHSDEDPIPDSNNEKLCAENLDTAKNNLTEQQEVVLKLLAELKICLKDKVEMKTVLNENFENYCKDKFKVPISGLSEEDDAKIQDASIDIQVKLVDSLIDEEKKSQINEKVIKINILKKIMDKALRKDLKLKAKKCLGWRNFAAYS